MTDAREISEPEADDIRRRFDKVYTSNVADVLDTMGLPDQGLHPSFLPRPAGAAKLAGWAFTIHGRMVPYAATGGDPVKMAACEKLEPGSVAVWGGAGEGICFFGELIALRMKERGCVGALVDGGVRDVGWIGHHGFPVYARYTTPVQSIGRWRVDDDGVPVALPGATTSLVRVDPGDFVLADEDGAIVIPRAVVVEVLEQSEKLGEQEDAIRELLGSGLGLDAALERFGHV